MDVLYIYNDDGSCDFDDWLTSLRDKIARAAIRSRLDRAENGNLGFIESVGDGVHELKIDVGIGYRVYVHRNGSEIMDPCWLG